MDRYVSLLRSLRLKVTPQRVAIVRLLFEGKGHPTAEEVYAKVKSEFPSISRATVYNTLKTLKSRGKISELEFAGGSRFDAVTEPHINLVCVKCGRIEDLHDRLVEKLHDSVKARTKYRVTHSRIEFLGYCERCKGNL